MRKLFVYLGATLAMIWGAAHLFPTRSVVKGFGNITADNVQIIRMEWINEGLTLIFIGLLTIVCTILNKDESRVIKAVYMLVFIMLISMSILSLFTGFKVDFLPFRLCPFIFTSSGLMILQGIRSGK